MHSLRSCLLGATVGGYVSGMFILSWILGKGSALALTKGDLRLKRAKHLKGMAKRVSLTQRIYDFIRSINNKLKL